MPSAEQSPQIYFEFCEIVPGRQARVLPSLILGHNVTAGRPGRFREGSAVMLGSTVLRVSYSHRNDLSEVPGSPLTPSLPATPRSPGAPLAPISPWGPGGPAGPSKHPARVSVAEQTALMAALRMCCLQPFPVACVSVH